jgi:hypothetical protein
MKKKYKGVKILVSNKETREAQILLVKSSGGIVKKIGQELLAIWEEDNFPKELVYPGAKILTFGEEILNLLDYDEVN